MRQILLVRATQPNRLKADDVKRLKELEAENARLKRIVADKEPVAERNANTDLVPAGRRLAHLQTTGTTTSNTATTTVTWSRFRSRNVPTTSGAGASVE